MAKHALIQLGTLTDNGQRHDFQGDTPPDLTHKSPALKWVPVVIADDPAFDPATQRLQKASDVVTATELTQSREIVALSQEEIDARAEQASHNSEGANTSNWITTLRAGNATNTQVQKALAWAIRQLDGPQ